MKNTWMGEAIMALLFALCVLVALVMLTSCAQGGIGPAGTQEGRMAKHSSRPCFGGAGASAWPAPPFYPEAA